MRVLLLVLAVSACLGIWLAPHARPAADRFVELRFEDDEGNYQDGYAEPGVGYEVLWIARTGPDDFILQDRSSRIEYRGLHRADVAPQVRRLLTPRLKSYDPRSGEIRDVGVANERGGDAFEGLYTRLQYDLCALPYPRD